MLRQETSFHAPANCFRQIVNAGCTRSIACLVNLRARKIIWNILDGSGVVEIVKRIVLLLLFQSIYFDKLHNFEHFKSSTLNSITL